MSSEPLYPSRRLFVEAAFLESGMLALSPESSHYLTQVMRARIGNPVVVFNGGQGEWLAIIQHVGRKQVTLQLLHQIRAPKPLPSFGLLFAPIKQGRVDWLVEKATELGIRWMQPILTDRTIVRKVNEQRLRAHAIEAAEQTERLEVPEMHTIETLPRALANLAPGTILLHADEYGSGAPVLEVLQTLPEAPIVALVGPEGGFTQRERELIARYKETTAVSLGPRILRADTAALALLTCLQAARGDWNERPDWRRGTNHE